MNENLINPLRSIKLAVKDVMARAIAFTVPPAIFQDKRYFKLWESRGYHITPVHFYETLPDTRTLDPNLWARPSEMVGVDMNEAKQLDLLSEFTTRYKSEYDGIEPMKRGTPDWETLYCMIRLFKPKRVIEIGSGVSTRVAAMALLKNREETGNDARLIAIEPYPEQSLRDGFPGLTELKATPVQEVPLEEFTLLEENDILFIDSSHVLKVGSDVQYEFLEVIPRLRKGVLVHIHDIFFPYEYPREWQTDSQIFWNEEYLLQAFLAFNSDFQVLCSNSYLHHRHPEAMKQAFRLYNPAHHLPGSLWMKRAR